MGYRKAEQILPEEVIKLIQEYIDGEYIYIPRKENKRRSWGEGTNIKEELLERNEKIFMDYKDGLSIRNISRKYYLSEKSIQRIVYKMRKSA